MSENCGTDISGKYLCRPVAGIVHYGIVPTLTRFATNLEEYPDHWFTGWRFVFTGRQRHEWCWVEDNKSGIIETTDGTGSIPVYGESFILVPWLT